MGAIADGFGSYGFGGGFALLIVLFILLVIIGCSFCGGYGGGLIIINQFLNERRIYSCMVTVVMADTDMVVVDSLEVVGSP